MKPTIIISAIISIRWIEHHCNKQTSSCEGQADHEQPAFTSSCFDLKGISGEAEMSKAFFWIRLSLTGYVSLVEQKVGVMNHPQESFWCEAVNLRNFMYIWEFQKAAICLELSFRSHPTDSPVGATWYPRGSRSSQREKAALSTWCGCWTTKNRGIKPPKSSMDS